MDATPAIIAEPLTEPDRPRHWTLEFETVRHLRGLSQNELARLSGIRQSCMSRLFECGNPSVRTLERLALALGCHLAITLVPLTALPLQSVPPLKRKRKSPTRKPLINGVGAP